MRRVLLISAFMTLCWASIVWTLQQNRHSIQKLTARLRASATENPDYWRGEWQRLGIAAREKAYLYDQWLEEGFLEHGMVVNRHSDGRPSGECDSLLFSSLRFTALMKLGWHDKAYQVCLYLPGKKTSLPWPAQTQGFLGCFRLCRQVE
jgi:hypothetical protein